jgi:hypothetical protein
MMAERTERVTVPFKPDQLAELRALAEQEERSLAQTVRHLVKQGLESTYELEND